VNLQCSAVHKHLPQSGEQLEVSSPSSRTGAKRPAAIRTGAKRPASQRPASQRPGVQRTGAKSSRSRRQPKTAVPRAVLLQRLGIVTFVLAAAVALLLVPARGYMAQRHEISAHRAELTDLEQQNQELTLRRDRLDDPSEIQRIARRDYGLVLEGEESYSILPPASAGLVLPRAWPFGLVQEPLEQATLAP
jgi:cell division protein FtsB